MMRKNIYLVFAAVAAALLTSCAETYQFCQIYETRPVHDDGQIKEGYNGPSYEDSQCIIEYCFWANGGSADFSFYNKTDEIAYIDLAKSFFVKNGVAYDLYRGREWSESASVGVASAVSYNVAGRLLDVSSGSAVAQTASSTVTVKEKQIIAVPPHSKKYIRTDSISASPMLSCDLLRYPSRSARLSYTAGSSPYRFSDVITYSVGDTSKPVTVTNEFYVSSVTNYAEPEVVMMKLREEVCDNMKDADYVAPTKDLYDKVVKEDVCEIASSFYQTYSTRTGKKLYENNWTEDYVYDNQYDAYVKKTGLNGAMLGMFAGILTLVAVMAILK